jgi:hypothetical protein
MNQYSSSWQYMRFDECYDLTLLPFSLHLEIGNSKILEYKLVRKDNWYADEEQLTHAYYTYFTNVTGI